MLAAAFLALGLVLIVEGLAYALAPSLLERMLQLLADTPEQALRLMGALSIVAGLILIWLAHVFGVTIQL
jgi:uncharacterized protein YjeT (DUF2065 family)